MGDFEARASAFVESPLGYHPLGFEILTLRSDPGSGQCLMDSLTGAVASKIVTEAFKGSLRMVGNHLYRVQRQKGA